MFATLASGYPRPPLPADATGDDLVRAVIAELEAAGLEILSDGGVRREDPLGGIASRLQGFDIGEPRPFLGTGRTYRQPRAIHEPRWDGAIFVREWEVAAADTTMLVKQAIVGPYTLGRLADPGPLSRERLTMALADALAHELRVLLAAGCPLIQIDEPAATLIGASTDEQQLFKVAHRRLTNSVRGAHLTLAVTGGSIANMLPHILFDAPYFSYLIDVVSAPENWALIGRAPAERGILVGVADARTDAADDPAYLAWAGLFAASLHGRGSDRVGLAPSGSLTDVAPAAAAAKIRALASAAQDTHALVEESPDALDSAKLTQEGVSRGYLPRVPGAGSAAPGG